jgi:hypothetical protein
MKKPTILLASADGRAFEVPESVVKKYQVSPASLKKAIARVQKLDPKKIPARLRSEWKRTTDQVQEVEGQADGVFALLILIKLAAIAIRIAVAMNKQDPPRDDDY